MHKLKRIINLIKKSFSLIKCALKQAIGTGFKKYPIILDKNCIKNSVKEKLSSMFLESTGYAPSIDYPVTFNEKIQWYKLYYRDPLMTKCNDKYNVREYIKEKVGEEYLVKILRGDKIDICTDDGCHRDESIMTCFKSMFPYLAPNFLYFIEDNSNVYKQLKLEFPQFEINNYGELTVVSNRNA